LIEAATGNHVWAERYDRDLADIFSVQDEITEQVVAAIEPELYAAEQVRSQSKPPDNLDAWECVMRALSLIGQGTRNENSEAEALCRRAIALGYGRAHSLLAWVLLRRTLWSGDLRTAVPEISAELHTAFTFDDRDPWVHFAQGVLQLRLHHPGEAARSLRRALELNPNFALAHAFLGNVLAIANQGVHQEAVTSAEHALRLSPRDRHVGTYASLGLAQINLAAGRYPECVTWARSMIEKSPGHIAGHCLLTGALALQGELAAAAEARGTLLRLRPEFSLTWMAENMPQTGELAECLREGLRKAGLPEE
jgi:tetratricopeptide (TPR) repeat protein